MVDLDEMISAEEAKRNRELCRKYPFLLPYEALIETDDGDFLPKTDTDCIGDAASVVIE